ncbi:MAG: hypothetical protein JO143_01070 [Acetobacteraceae bacterium]|nr:hypothetical protein [Acetobacteraceae bacterium]
MRYATSMAAGLAMLVVGLGTARAETASSVGVTTGDLAKACSDTQNEAATGYCRGFMTGVGQYSADMTGGRGRDSPIFCLPSPSPTLETAQASFAAWAQANPQYASERAADGLMRWAATTYPCPTVPRSAGARRP